MIATSKVATNSNWIQKPSKEYFTHDDLIDAYLQGKEQQNTDNQKILLEKLEFNINLAKSQVEIINNLLLEKGFNPFKSYLRINNVIKFDAIFDVSIMDFTSDEFDDVYTQSRVIKKSINTETFNLNFTFMPHSDNLNEKRLSCDGFIFVYEKRR